jgi:PAS domain S-box-containing protein
MLVQNSIYLDLAIVGQPLTINPDVAIIAAIRLMNQSLHAAETEHCDRRLLESRASCVLVMNGVQLLGTFSKWDVLRLVEQDVDLYQTLMSKAIMADPILIKRSQIQDLEIMFDLLQQSLCRHLVVVDDDDQVLGLATQESILFAKNKLTADTLINIEAQKKAVLTAIPDLIYRISSDGVYLECFASNYVTDLLPSGFDMVGKKLSDLLTPELSSRKLTAIRQAIATGQMQTFEQQWQINDVVQYEEVQIVRVSDQEALTIISNISDRKRAEESLRESEMRFRSVFDGAAVGISLAAPDGTHLSVNPALCQMLGYTASEMQIRTFQEITHPDDLEMDLYNYRKLLNNEIDSFHIEKRFRHKNGEFIWGLLSVSIVRDSQNRPMYDIALIQNINELKKTQQQLSLLNQDLEIKIQQRTEELVKSETRKQEILNAIPDLVLRLNLQGDCIDCILPRIPDKEAFIPIKEHISEVLEPTILESHLAASRLAIATGEVQIYEHQLQKFDKLIYEEVRISPCSNDQVLVLVRNVSDRKQAEANLQLSNERLITMNQELERATRLKDEFLATMSHELRTPLNAILGISEGLIEQVFGELNQRQQDSLKTIHNSGQHLLDLINDILDVAKIESGMFTLYLSSVSVRYLCDSSLAFIKNLATQKNIQVSLVIDPALPKTIRVDERRIRQLLINLLSNAVKFTPRDGKVMLEAKFVSNDVSPSVNELHFLVSDTGIGIAEGDISKLFQPFVQIDSNLSRQYAGTGLGLNLVKKMAEMHGGQVSVTSKVGEGSCFTVILPHTESDS